ncbi:MAG: Maf family protein [Pseudobdellovibrio sp.]
MDNTDNTLKHMNLILGSTSVYRKELMQKLGLEFNCIKPLCDEEILKQQLLDAKASPLKVAESLAMEKALSIQNTLTSQEKISTTIIGCDQLVDFNHQILGKPKTPDTAIKQLSLMSGKTHNLITSVAILHGEQQWTLNHISKMVMKDLSLREITHYIEKDQPLDCAGSYKIECSGIALFKKIETDDFSAIQGLPVMWVSQILQEIGYALFSKK